MSVFLVAALNSLGLGATLVALSVVALDAWSRGSSNSSSRGGGGSMMLLAKAYAPLMHAGAALLVRQMDRQTGRLLLLVMFLSELMHA